MKTPLHIVFAALLAAGLLTGCSPKDAPVRTGKPSVFVSILPQAGLAKTLAGDWIDVHTLVGEGQSPHTYEPTPRQLAQLADADSLLVIGIPFEKHLLRKIGPLYPQLSIVETQAGIALRTMEHASHDGPCTHDHGETDPHVWLSPLNATVIAKNICAEFQRLDPPHAADYRTNLDRLTGELTALDAEIRAVFAPHKGQRFYVFHPAFGYFGDACGLVQVPIELEGKSPSPRQMAQLVDQARADGVKIVFVQQQFPADSAQAIAEALGGTVVRIDPLAEDNVANLRSIALSVRQSMNP